MSRILLLIALFGIPAIAQTPKEATVRVYSERDGDKWPDFYGSGVLVRDTYVLTNAHVVVGNKSLTIRFSDGLRMPAKVEFQDEKLDVALLSVGPHPTFTGLPIGVDAKYSDTIKTYGYTYDYEFTERTGVMWHRRQPGTNPGGDEEREEGVPKMNFWSEPDDNGAWFAIAHSESEPGDSGGPVVKDGKLIGIVEGIGDGWTVAVRIDTVLKLVGDKIKPKLRLK